MKLFMKFDELKQLFTYQNFNFLDYIRLPEICKYYVVNKSTSSSTEPATKINTFSYSRGFHQTF